MLTSELLLRNFAIKNLMRKLLLFLFISLASIAWGNDVSPRICVNPAVEFVSAVCRTAGFEEYVNNCNTDYARTVDSLFLPFVEHPAIAFLQAVREHQYVGYDAIAIFALYLKADNGGLQLSPETNLPAEDHRWKSGQADSLVVLLDDLYRQSNFDGFFKSNVDFYGAAVRNMDALLEKTDLAWLWDFFGKKPTGGEVVISLLNNGNYGMSRHRQGLPDESVIIVGCFNKDEHNIPVFDGRESLIIHESSHPMTNPLVIDNLKLFNDNLSAAAHLMEAPLATKSYRGGLSLMCESMVRGVEIQYAFAHGDSLAANRRMASEMMAGFIFLPEILEAFGRYSANRRFFPVIDSIMPEIIRSINNTDATARYEEIMSASPEILSCSLPFGATVSAGESLAVSFTFSCPVKRGSFGMGELRDLDIPALSSTRRPSIELSDDRKTLTIYLQTQPGMEYGMTMYGNFYQGDSGFPGRGKVEVLFRTVN